MTQMMMAYNLRKGGGLGLGGYGTARLPLVTPSNASTNDFGLGTTYNPPDGPTLNALLSSGTLAGGNIIRVNDNTDYGPVYLPPVAGASWDNPIWLVTSDLSRIPVPGQRTGLANRSATAHFRCTPGTKAIEVGPKANGWALVGIQADQGTSINCAGLVVVGPTNQEAWDPTHTYFTGQLVYDATGSYICLATNINQSPSTSPLFWEVFTLAHLPDGIRIDRCDFSMAVTNGSSSPTVVKLECKKAIVINSYIYNPGDASESHGFGAINSAGPLLIENNSCAAATIPLIFGGAPPAFDTVPTDVTIRRNRFWKELSWCPQDPSYVPRTFDTKNLFEFKVVLRALIEDNYFGPGWDGVRSQQYDIVFKISTGADPGQGPGFTNAITKDITFRYNRLHETQGVFGIGARDAYGGGTVGVVQDVSIYHNYTDAPCGLHSADGARTWLLQYSATAETGNCFIGYNTLVTDTPRVDVAAIFCEEPAKAQNLTYQNNITTFGAIYGGYRTDSFAFLGDAVFNAGLPCRGNYLVDIVNNQPSVGGTYAVTAALLATYAQALVNFAGGDYRTAAALVGAGYGGATPGCDVATVLSRTSGCLTGIWP